MDDRSGKYSPRDEAMLTDLYFDPYLTTEQLHYGNFPTLAACKRHLYRLKKNKGGIDCHQPRKGLTMWRLTRESWLREQENFPKERSERGRHLARWRRKWPKGEKVDHIVAINDLWMRLSPKLDRDLGRFPEWEWTDERRAYQTDSLIHLHMDVTALAGISLMDMAPQGSSPVTWCTTGDPSSL
jgi:hypothetical protein